MVWQILLCALAAAGLLCVIWLGIGLLLMPFSARGSAMVVFADENVGRLEQQVRAYAWLIDCGLLRSRMLLAVSNAEQWEVGRRLSSDYKWLSCVWLEDLTENLLQTTDGGADFFDNK